MPGKLYPGGSAADQRAFGRAGYCAQDIERTVIMTRNGTPLRVKDIALVSQGPKIRLGQFARALHHEDGKIVDNDDVVSGIVLLRKGAAADAALQGIHDKVKELNDHILPPGVKVVPFIDRSDLVHFTSHTVLHNLTEGMILVSIVLFLFLGNVRGALIVAATIPFSLLFASICLDFRHIPQSRPERGLPAPLSAASRRWQLRPVSPGRAGLARPCPLARARPASV